MTCNLLFICSKNKLRSPTAEQVFSTWQDVECDCAGLAPDANVVLSTEQVDWADIIFVMEKAQRAKLATKFKPYLKNKRVIVLNIPDNYKFMDPDLIAILKAKVPPHIR